MNAIRDQLSSLCFRASVWRLGLIMSVKLLAVLFACPRRPVNTVLSPFIPLTQRQICVKKWSAHRIAWHAITHSLAYFVPKATHLPYLNNRLSAVIYPPQQPPLLSPALILTRIACYAHRLRVYVCCVRSDGSLIKMNKTMRQAASSRCA